MSLGAAAAPVAQNPPNVNYQLMRLYIESIPNFNGNDDHTLEIFIEHCNSLIETYQNRNNAHDPLNTFLIRAVIGKLTGRALMLVGSRPEVRNWDDLKTLLRLSFGDQRNLDCLVQELIAMRPHKNESFTAFGQRIQKSRSAISSKLKSMNFNLAQRTFRMENYDELALKTYLRGLTGRIQDMVRLRDPDSLELAMSYVLEEENFLLNQRQFLGMSSSNNHNNNHHSNRMSLPKTQPTQSYNNSRNPNSNSFSFNNKPFQPFYNMNQQPNFQYNQYRPPTFAQPRQNFPPPNQFPFQQNVWKPTGQIPKDRPTPMSISTRNSSLQNKNRNTPQINFIESSNENIPNEGHLNQNDNPVDDSNHSEFNNFPPDYEQYFPENQYHLNNFIPNDSEDNLNSEQNENFQIYPQQDDAT